MTALRVLIRADGGASVGWGHIKRSLALARSLQDLAGAELHLVTGGEPVAVTALLAGGRCAHTALASPEPAQEIPGTAVAATAETAAETATEMSSEMAGVLRAWRPDVIIVDHYHLGASWHRAARACCGALIVAIDDLANRALDPDLLIDHNPGDDHAAKYRAVLPPQVPLCGGTGFALLDPVYAQHRRPPLPDTVGAIGLFMGATDPAQHLPWLVRVLRQQAGWQGPIRLACSSANRHLGAVQALCQADAGLRCDVDLPDLAGFFASVDLALVAGGGALWECCSQGVPALALVTAANQRQAVPFAVARGAVRGVDAVERSDLAAQQVADQVRALLADRPLRLQLAGQARQLVDGRGALRAARRILQLLDARATAQGTAGAGPSELQIQMQMQLRPATLDDAQRLFDWRNDPATRDASHQAQPLDWAAHLRWFRAALDDPSRQLCVAWAGDQAVGTVRADRAPDSAAATLSWTVAPECRGRGLGSQLVQAATRHWPQPLHAQIKPSNLASIRAATSAGFTLLRGDAELLQFHHPGPPD